MNKTYPHLTPWLENEMVALRPLIPEDFETLHLVASDPLIWEQHPSPDRYKPEVFRLFFEEALKNGAFLISDKSTGMVIGSSRFYDFNTDTDSMAIGYTFLARDYWGGVFNRNIKELMLAYAFSIVRHVYFYVGSGNVRSQKAMEKIGGVPVGEECKFYSGKPVVSIIYRMSRPDSDPMPGTDK